MSADDQQQLLKKNLAQLQKALEQSCVIQSIF